MGNQKNSPLQDMYSWDQLERYDMDVSEDHRTMELLHV